jgi:hypothetical protein
MQKAFFSFDIEADGPSPCQNSMRSFGAVLLSEQCAVLWRREFNLVPLDGHVQDHRTMTEFWALFPEAWEHCNRNQCDPVKAFTKLATEIETLKEKYDITPVAAPAAYDWQWVNYYFQNASVDNPLGYTAFCISTFLKSINPSKSIKTDSKFEKQFDDEKYPHTHMPLDDAIEEGMRFLKALEWHRSHKE